MGVEEFPEGNKGGGFLAHHPLNENLQALSAPKIFISG